MRKQKAAGKDFTENNLPHNRREVFFDVIKQRYDVILKLGVAIFLFMLPVLLIKAIGNITYNNMIEQGGYTYEELSAIGQTLALIDILPISVLGFCFAGVMKVIRNLVWGEPIFFFKDFFSGIKQNRIYFVFVFLFFALINFLLSYINVLIEDELLRAIPTVLCLTLLLPVGMFFLSATVVYNDGFLTILKNSVIFFIKSAPVCILFVLAFAASFLLDYIELMVVRYILIIALIIVALPIYLIAWTLYSHSVFDKMVNSKLYPDYVDKGIYRIK